MTKPLYRLQQTVLQHPDGRTALNGIDLTVMPGERIVLLGANGSGKSTLLRVMNALLWPTNGKIQYQGKPLNEKQMKDRAFSRQFRSDVALMFQHPEAMLFNPTVGEEIAYGLRQLSNTERQEAVSYWSRLMRLEDKLDAPPSQLSGGEKQRLCLACLLAIEPKVLLMDEPTTNLDPNTTGWLLEWLSKRDLTTITATHQLSLAPLFGDRAVVLGPDHTVVFDGPLEEALQDSALLEQCNLTSDYLLRHQAAPGV